MGYFSDYNVDNGDEWERYSDIGGDMADMGFAEDYYASTEELREMRRRSLVGKYVVVCDSKHTGKGVRYLQDQGICDSFIGHYWTNYIENAKGYVDITAAFIRCRNLQYGNPRVMFVTGEYKLKEVDRFGHFTESSHGGRIYCSKQCNDKTNSNRVRSRKVYDNARYEYTASRTEHGIIQ